MTFPAPDVHIPMCTDTLQVDNPGSEVVVDWDMAAVGVTDWTEVNGAGSVMSKVSNGAGGQALRITYDGTANPGAQQTIMTSTYNYVHSVRIRTDGSTTGKVYLGGTLIAHFRALTQWQRIDLNYEALGTDLLIQADATGAGQYIEVDFVSLKEFKSRFLDISGNDHHMVLGDGVDPITIPQLFKDIGLRIGTNTAFGEIPAGATESSTAMSMSILLYDMNDVFRDSVGAVNASGVFFRLRYDSINDRFLFFSGSDASGNNAAKYVIDPQNLPGFHHVVGVHDGSATKIYVNGTPGTNAPTPVAPNHQSQAIRFGQYYDGTSQFIGNEAGFRFWPTTALNQSEALEVYQLDVREYSRLYV